MKKINKNIVIYQAKSGAIELRGDFTRETIWATQAQIVNLFGVDQSVVSRHINNIFKDGEIDKKSNMQKMHIANSDKPVIFYSLDVVLGVGYRTNSRVAIEFRQWATKTLRRYIVDGFAVNQKRLLEQKNKFQELQEIISFLQEKSKNELLAGQEGEIMALLADYSKSLALLEKYDKDSLTLSKAGRSKFKLSYAATKLIIGEIKNNLLDKKEAGELFGQEYGEKMQGIVGGIYQAFGGKELYQSIEEKAAHLLYFTVKDHPFVDGNKRIASFLFVYFLDKNKYLYKATGERKINDNALAILALLVAVSDPKEKDKMIKITTNLLSA